MFSQNNKIKWFTNEDLEKKWCHRVINLVNHAHPHGLYFAIYILPIMVIYTSSCKSNTFWFFKKHILSAFTKRFAF